MKIYPKQSMLMALILIILLFGCGQDNQNTEVESETQPTKTYTKADYKQLRDELLKNGNAIELEDDFLHFLPDSQVIYQVSKKDNKSLLYTLNNDEYNEKGVRFYGTGYGGTKEVIKVRFNIDKSVIVTRNFDGKEYDYKGTLKKNVPMVSSKGKAPGHVSVEHYKDLYKSKLKTGYGLINQVFIFQFLPDDSMHMTIITENIEVKFKLIDIKFEENGIEGKYVAKNGKELYLTIRDHFNNNISVMSKTPSKGIVQHYKMIIKKLSE